MEGDTSISGKKIVEESLVKASGIWGGEVVQDGLNIDAFFEIQHRDFPQRNRTKHQAIIILRESDLLFCAARYFARL